MKKAQVIFLVTLLLAGLGLMYAQARPTVNSPLPPIGQRATISVTDLTGGVTANDLVQNLVGGGVATSNIVYTGSDLAAGVYLGGTQAGIGINGGIILSTGGALLATGPNSESGITYSHSLPGDADLNALMGSTNTGDACVLEFDFIPQTENLQFTFVLGSDEYEEFIASYFDVFAFFLNGVNIALIPGTTTPITIGTINHTINQSYYVSNNSWPGPYDIECDGFTVPISINATVTPGVTNHIKLAIADYLDLSVDSWIFISAGTFISGYNVYVDSTPQGARIFKDGVDTALNTPASISQVTGTSSTYWVELPGYTWVPPTQSVPDIQSNQSIFFNGYPGTTPVELSSFTATSSAEGYVDLRWTTESETDMLGYRVYRAESSQMDGSLSITPILIGATNTSSQSVYQHEDHEVEINTTYYYWLEGVNVNASQFFGPVSATVTGQDTPEMPTQNMLGNAYPNPFKTGTSFSVDIKDGEQGTVNIYNSQGRLVRSFEVGAGSREIHWDGLDHNGNRCVSGVYLYKLSTQSLNETKKMLIVK